jgi:excisionase family DNA binding protein
MSEPVKNPFDLLLEQFRVIVREEIAAALERKQPVKLQYTLDEAAKRLNVKPSLLGGKVRAGILPYHRAGRRIYFTESDLLQIDQLTAVEPKSGNGIS